MLKRILQLGALLCAAPAFAATVNVNASMTPQQIQSAMASAASGSTISFAAGTYNITSALSIPCSNLQLTGPVANPSTAILIANLTNNAMIDYPANCMSLGSIQYLGLQNPGGTVYFGIGNNGNFSFMHNQVASLQTGAGLFFDGNLGTKLTGVQVKYNTFGNPNSCAAIFADVNDRGGYCAGVITSQGEDNNIDIEYNVFNHVEEGIHFNQMASYNPGQPNSVCVSCIVSYNWVNNYHRIAIEIQVSTPTNPIQLQHNAVTDPLNSSWGTFAVSLACCQSGYTIGQNGNSPGYIFNDNVVTSTQPAGSKPPPYAVEFWGTGPQGTNSLIEGNFSNGYTWGWGAPQGTNTWAINNNYICGPNYPTQGGYISNQQHQSDTAAPSQTGNVTSATCQAKASTSPTLSPATGSFAGSLSVAMADASANTSIWYTTDGTTPAPGKSTLYTAPFTITNTTTVKAIAMWGSSNQPFSYPVGYGYVPSAVQSATYTLNAPTPPTPPTPPTTNCLDMKLTILTGAGTSNMTGTFTSAPTPCN